MFRSKEGVDFRGRIYMGVMALSSLGMMHDKVVSSRYQDHVCINEPR